MPNQQPALIQEFSLIPPKLPVFARHESFHPRFGWLKKAYDAAIADPDVFHRDNAQVTLGVGKNMVRAIRYWAVAFKILQEALLPDRDAAGVIATEFGVRLLDSDTGWDPYIEHPGTLWLLHWRLLQAPSQATAWDFAFHHYRRPGFAADELTAALLEYKAHKYPMAKGNESSLKKDVACLLRMYVPGRKRPEVLEDSIDSPFTELGLIGHGAERNHYVFRLGGKRSLPNEVVVAACLEHAESIRSTERTISLSRLLYDPGSPGMAFKLNEAALAHALDAVPAGKSGMSLHDAAGVVMATLPEQPEDAAMRVLGAMYGH